METLFIEEELKNSLKNKLDQSDKRFHDWFRFVLSFPPHLVRKYIGEFGLKEDDLLLDPFCGTGTTLVEAKLLNIPSVGIEANPSVHFASTVKIDWEINPDRLIEVASEIRKCVLNQFEASGLSDFPLKENLKVNHLRKLNPEQEKLILTNSISPLPLHKTLVLLDFIKQHHAIEFRNHFLLALSNTLVNEISNLRFGPEVGVGKIKDDVAVVELWYSEIKKITRDLNSIQEKIIAHSEVHLSDARNMHSVLQPNSISSVITSPPYPNEKDYTRTTRLESVLLGFVNTKKDLQQLKKSLVRSNTRGVYKGDDDDDYVKNFSEIQKIASLIENRRLELGKTSGFEKLYAKVTKLYFGGMAKHLIELRKVLKPNAKLAYVVGDQASYLRVMIRTGNLLAEIAETLGYELVRIDLFRTRFSTATKSDLREEVVILRWKSN